MQVRTGLEASTGFLREVVRRSLDGPVMREIDFDRKLSQQARLLTSEYSIRFDLEEIVCDDRTADCIWQAALELLSRVGIYNFDTNRLVQLEKREIEAEAARTLKEVVLGEGKDAVTIPARAHDSKVPPVILPLPGRGSHVRGFNSIFHDVLDAYASDDGPLGVLAWRLKDEVNGIPHLAKTPAEVIWGKATARWRRAIVAYMGRPGHWLGDCEEISPGAIIACFAEDGLLNRSNAFLGVALMPEFKLNWDRLTLAYAGQTMGVCRFMSSLPIYGAYYASPEQTAVAAVAMLLGIMSYAGDEKLANIDVVRRQGFGTVRGQIQASVGAFRAVERHLGIPVHGFHDTQSGLGTSLCLYEKAARALALTGSGWSWNGLTYFCWPGPDAGYRTEMDYDFVMKICRGASGLRRERTNELLVKLLPLFEGKPVDTGKSFFHYYDIKTLTPSGELVALYARVEEELQALGVPMGN